MTRSHRKIEQKKALKRLGGVQRYEPNKSCIKDMFEIGEKTKNIQKERAQELAKEKKKFQSIFKAVELFQEKMSVNRNDLDEVMNAGRRNASDWEVEMQAAVLEFDEERYMRNEYD